MNSVKDIIFKNKPPILENRLSPKDTLYLSLFLKLLLNNMISKQYDPSIHDKKILTIIACNTESLIKLNGTINNLKYFSFKNNDIIMINSSDAKYNSELKNKMTGVITKYYEIPNDKALLDFGKWIHVLNNININDYDYVVFSNDSIIIQGNISHFFNNMINKNVDFYGYNDSTQLKYHYQSYLFGLKSSQTHNLIKMVNDRKHLIKDYKSLICNTEILMTDYFVNNDCFLKIGNIPSHKGKNIYFENNIFYNLLFKKKILPILKVKKILL